MPLRIIMLAGEGRSERGAVFRMCALNGQCVWSEVKLKDACCSRRAVSVQQDGLVYNWSTWKLKLLFRCDGM